MNNPIAAYTQWLHTRWPAGTVEKLPVTGENGITNLPGVRIAGDLSGIPLLKFSSQTATKAMRAILKEPEFQTRDTSQTDVLDIAIIGAGVAGVSAGIEALERTGNLLVLYQADGKTTRAHRVIVAIGRSGNFRKLGCPGEDLDKVYNRLFDPKEFAGKEVLVVGGGDTALETAIAIAACGGKVTLSYRKKEFARPKPENVEKLEMLVKDPAAHVAVERPTSERVTTAAR